MFFKKQHTDGRANGYDICVKYSCTELYKFVTLQISDVLSQARCYFNPIAREAA